MEEEKKEYKFKINDRVLCYHGPLIYEAKVQIETIIILSVCWSCMLIDSSNQMGREWALLLCAL
jgi:hypothetical protein